MCLVWIAKSNVLEICQLQQTHLFAQIAEIWFVEDVIAGNIKIKEIILILSKGFSARQA